MTAAHRFVIATRSLAIAFVTAAVLSRPVLSFFGSKNASSMETQFYYFLGESAKIVNNQKRIAHKQNAPPAVLADVDAVHSVFAKDFQALRFVNAGTSAILTELAPLSCTLSCWHKNTIDVLLDCVQNGA